MSSQTPSQEHSGFMPEDEQALGARFIDQGYLILPVEDANAAHRIRRLVCEVAAGFVGIDPPRDENAFLNGIAERMSLAKLNEFRLAVIAGMNAAEWFRPAYFSLARRTLETIVGNEIAMQRRINLSIQLPNDDSSLLAVHSDTWSGDSPFEVVLWYPLVDCYRTKSMYILPPGPNAGLQERLHRMERMSTDAIYESIEPDLEWLDVPFGNFLLFNQNLAHGNRVNREADTRWTMNCRFKGVFTPYADKKLGEFFEPITLRPASRIGLGYALPGGFDADA